MIVYFLAILFLLLSSFIKCLVDSKLNKEFFYRRSQCCNCNKKLNFIDLVPVLSYIFLRGKCRYCNYKIPTDVFLYEVFALVISIIYLATVDKVLFLNFFDYFTVMLLIFIAIEDIKKFEIDEKLQVILLVTNIANIFSKNNFSNLKYSILLVIMYHIIYFILKSGIGYGDIKLFSILCLTLNFFDGLYLFLYTFILAGFFSIYLILVKKIDRKTKIPLAPYICLAYIIVLINGEVLLW
ncbi:MULTISPECIES: A24 family peptidase [unclassified Gemella]|uniref:prepilin peptidase n=1 Tax=unclassified Gemella TaxID=2624949 RepID=UPI001C05C421|nr:MULTISPECIES: A24 family peptidase [unclassified Gemella]MBU0278782.1 A24 family peptidase [Gemella sp. zg-1178]QWQ38720.1 A24 family peptidase [Gemella sp. zg-570]